MVKKKPIAPDPKAPVDKSKCQHSYNWLELMRRYRKGLLKECKNCGGLK